MRIWKGGGTKAAGGFIGIDFGRLKGPSGPENQEYIHEFIEHCRANDFNTIDYDIARTPSQHTRNQIARDFLAVQSGGRLQRMTSFEDGHAWELCLKNGFATRWRLESQ